MYQKRLKDIKTRLKFCKEEKKRICIKFLSDNLKGFFPKKSQKSGSKTRIVRRCIITNRSRACIRPYNISRIKLRQMLQFGLIPGFKKSS